MFKKIRSSAIAAAAAIALVVAAPMAANASDLPAPDEETVTTEALPESAPAAPVEDQGDGAGTGDEPIVIEETVEDNTSDIVDSNEGSAPVVPIAPADVPSTEESGGPVVLGDQDAAWTPQSTLLLYGQACVAETGGTTPLIFEYGTVQGEGVYPVVLDGVTLPGDAGGFTVSVGFHEYSYSIVNLTTNESVPMGPFYFMVEPCDSEVIPVSPIGPQIDDVRQAIIVPNDPNFDYELESGQSLQPGDNVLGPIGPGNVIAVPKAGVSVDPNATIQWPFDFYEWVTQSRLYYVPQSCSVGGEPVKVDLVPYVDRNDALWLLTFDGVDTFDIDQGEDWGWWQIELTPGTYSFTYEVRNLADVGQHQRHVTLTGEVTVLSCDSELVSPIGPQIDDVRQAIIVPNDPNFDYELESGQSLQPGDNVLGPIGPGNVIAVPKAGVSVDPNATIQWPFDFKDDDGPQPPVFITPYTPTQIGNNVLIPSQDGVVYKDEDGNPVTGTVELTEDTCFTAEPSGDVPFAPLAQTRWCFTYTPVVNPPQEECQGFHVKNDKGECVPVDDTVITPPGGGTVDRPSDDTGLPKSGTSDDELARTGSEFDAVGWLTAAGLLVASGLLLAFRRRRSA